MSNPLNINSSQDVSGPHRLFDIPKSHKPRKSLSSFPKNSMTDILRAADKGINDKHQRKLFTNIPL